MRMRDGNGVDDDNYDDYDYDDGDDVACCVDVVKG